MEIGINDNQEDSLVMNKSSIDRGLYRCMSLKKYEDVSKKSNQNTTDDEFGIKDRSLVKGLNEKDKNYDKVNEKGFAPEETKLINGDIMIAKVSPITDGDGKLYRDESQAYKANIPGHVDKVWSKIYDGDGYQMIKIRIRSERTPMVGDKFCVTADHEVLTNNGWMRFDNLYNKYKTDNEFKQQLKVAQFNDGVMEYVEPTDVFEFDYNGQMYKLESQQIDFQVTLEHKLYVKYNNKTEFELIDAKNVYKNNVKYLTHNFETNLEDELDLINKFEELVNYNGKVYCLQVPSGIFMIKYNEKNHWTGNCSRHGNIFA